MRAAIIIDGKVENIIEVEALDALEGVNLIAAPTAAIGDAWDGEYFVSMPHPASPPLPRHMTILAFRNRFTRSEKVRIELAALDDPNASQEHRERAATVRVGQADLAAATYVDLQHSDTRADVEAFEIMGLLDAPGRALSILDDPVQPHERV